MFFFGRSVLPISFLTKVIPETSGKHIPLLERYAIIYVLAIAKIMYGHLSFGIHKSNAL